MAEFAEALTLPSTELLADRGLATLRGVLGTTPTAPLLQSLMVGEHITGHLLYLDNEVEILVDGRETYDAMHEAIDRARHSVCLEIYILADDAVGERLVELLCTVASRGVWIRVLLDGLGSRSALATLVPRLQAASVEVQVHHPLGLRNWRDVWYRDHRKLLIVDAAVAFTGGINFAETYASRRRSRLSPRRHAQRGWRDTHARFSGHCLRAFAESFDRRWGGEARAPLKGLVDGMAQLADGLAEDIAAGRGRASRRDSQRPARRGRAMVRLAESSGRDGINSEIVLSLVAAIERAQHRVWMTHAYFAPPTWFIKVLVAAARRGVDVRLLLPARSDFYPVQIVARSHYARLLRSGVRIFEYQAEILHAKCATIDGHWSTIGSCNLDWRSLKYNEELNAEIVSVGVAARLEDIFVRDVAHSLEIERRRWRVRGVHRRVAHWLMRRLQRWW